MPSKSPKRRRVPSLHLAIAFLAFGVSVVAYAGGVACPSPLTPVPTPIDTSCSFIPNPIGDPLVTDGCDDNADCVINPTFGASGGCFGANSSLECVPNSDSFPVVHRDITFNTSRIPWTCSCVTVSGYPPSNFTCPDGDFGGPCDYYPEIADEEEEPIPHDKP